MILADLILPDENGFDFLIALRKIPRYENTPFIMVTVDDTPKNRIRAKGLGATEFLQKPIDINKISYLIEKYCGEAPAV